MTTKYLLVTLYLSLFSVAAHAQKRVLSNVSNPNVKVQKLSEQVNSVAADFAPARYGDRIYFTSMGKEADGSVSSNIFSFTEGGRKNLVKDINMERKSSHIGHIAIMPDASRMYFTICQDDTQEKCTLWFREKEYEGSWGVAQKLPDIINQRGSTSTMPSIGWDEEQKKFALFFVSDRPGGRGGKDIWVCHIRFDGQFETPYPLPINTEKDDVTPYFDRRSQVLYFSTNGREGQGRFDIFASLKLGDMWSRPENLGRPYNSAYDDLYFMMHDFSGSAYLASDRPGSLCTTGFTDGLYCYDLYEVFGHVPDVSKPEHHMALQWLDEN